MALSVRQPFAWAIATVQKDVENRGWGTDYRGPLLLHASKTMTQDEYENGFYAIYDALTEERRATLSPLPKKAELPRGGLVGLVDVVGVVYPPGRDHLNSEASRIARLSPWYRGDHGLMLANAAAFPLLPYAGERGLFSVPTSRLTPAIVALLEARGA